MSIKVETALSAEEQVLLDRLKSFRVPGMARALESQLKDPNADLNTFMERISQLIDAEWQARADKRFNRLMKEAHLRYPTADLDETDLSSGTPAGYPDHRTPEHLPLDR